MSGTQTIPISLPAAISPAAETSAYIPQSLWPRARISAFGMLRSRMPVRGSTLVAAQRTIRLTTLKRAWAPMLTSDKIELAPGWPACDIDIAAEAQRVDRRIDYILERGDRGEVNDRDYLAGDVGEAVAVGVQNFRRPMQLVGKRGGEEVFD